MMVFHLNHQYIEKHPYVDGGYYFDYLHYPLGKSPYFMCGLYYIQEPSAMSVAACLDIKENDYVLDMCGAPGGKTCYVASRLSNEGLMIANDISKLRASILSSNILDSIPNSGLRLINRYSSLNKIMAIAFCAASLGLSSG